VRLYLAGQVLAAMGVLLVLPSMARCWPDCRRSCQLRWSRSSGVRTDLIAALRTGRPATTPAMAREVLEYVAVMRRGLKLLRTRAYLIAGGLFTVSGLLWIAESVRWSTPALAPSAAVLAAYPLWAWMYAATLGRKLDRAELGNADLAQRPDLYLVRSVELDCISN
jgi:predicted exporter